MEEQRLHLEYLGLDEITPYEYNARMHEKEDVDVIKASIKELGMNDPIGVWSDEANL